MSVSHNCIPLDNNDTISDDTNSSDSGNSANYDDYIKIATQNNFSMVMELDLLGCVKYISSQQWESLLGVSAPNNFQKISEFVSGTPQDKAVFDNAVEMMLQNDDISYTVTFNTWDSQDSLVPLEACGILIKDPHTHEPLYSMWNMKPYTEQQHKLALQQLLPESFIKKLGFGATIFASYIRQIENSGVINDIDLPIPRMELCRVCETFVPAWWLETHSQNCVVEHRIQSVVQLLHDNLVEQEKRLNEELKNDEWTIRQQNLLESLKELVEYAIDVNPSEPTTEQQYRTNINDDTSYFTSTNFQFSPNTKTNIQYIDNWNYPDLQDCIDELRDDSILTQLISDTIELTKKKVDSVRRLDNAMKYSQRIKDEVNDIAMQLIREQVENNRLKQAHSLSAQFVTPTGTSSTPTLPHVSLSPTNANYHSMDSLLHKIPSIYEPTDNDLQETPSQLDSNTLRTLGTAATFTQSHHNETFNTIDPNKIELPTLVTPQPKHVNDTDNHDNSKLFSESYLKNDELPRMGSTTHSSLSISKFTDDTPNRDKLSTPEPHQSKYPRHISRSITPSTQLDYDMYQSDTSHERNNSSFNSSNSVSNSSYQTPQMSTTKFSNTNSISQLQSTSNLNSNLPKLSTTISLTPRRGSPLPSNISSYNNATIKPLDDPQLRHFNNSIHSNTPSNFHNQMLRLDLEKSPISSPFALARDFLTPEQFPNNPASPNQPLSPLLLATNQVKTAQPSIRDYDILKPISKGAYGSVYLARKKLTGDYFAVKVLRKSDMIAKNQVMNVKSERAIMMFQSDKPYVAKLFATFQNKDNLFLVMEYLPGGDLATLIKMMDILPDEWVRQYLAEIIIGVDDMHQNGIIHHDLKPDNLLIDNKGHIKLTDFGLSRAGLVRRHKIFTRSKSVTSNNSNDETEINKSSIQSSVSETIGTTKTKKRSISSLKPPESDFLSTPTPRADSTNNNDFLNITKNDSQLSLSLFEVSRASTPPPQNFTNFSTPSGSKTEATSTNDTNLSNYSVPNIQKTTHSNSMSTVSSNTSHNSDLALFHPEDSKQDKKFFGTPDYLAPETIKGTGEGDECDWWSVGCIMFELLLGYPPFHANSPEAVFRNILAGNIQWPLFDSAEEESEFLSKDAKDLITKLLVLDPTQRLGVNGAEEVKDHPYFKTIDWKNVYDEEPSFVPTVDNPENTEYFDPRGAILENLEDSDDEASKTKEEYNITDNSDIPILNTSDGLSLSTPKGTPISSAPREWSGTSMAGTGEYLSPVNKLSISSVLESIDNSNTMGQIPENTGRNSSVPKSMSLAIPPHMRERRASKLNDAQTEFGSFYFRNLSALDKANKDVINRLKNEHFSDIPRVHRRTSSGSVAGSSSDTSSSKIKLHRSSLTGSPAFNPMPKNLMRSDSSSIKSFSPERSNSIDQGLGNISRKGSIISAIDKNTPISSNFIGTYTKSPNALFFSDTDSPTTSKFKSPLSPASNTFNKAHRSKLLSKTIINSQRSSTAEISSDETDRLQAVARVNTLRHRRRSSRRESNNTNNEIGYHMDILLCEPIPIHRYRAAKDLEDMGCTVVTASAGDELVSKATSGITFDLILIPLKLMNFNVLDIIKLIKHTNDINAKTPIIAITNYYQEAISTNMFDDVMEKPIDSAQLRRILSKYALKRSQEEAEDTIISDSDEMSSNVAH
ncbi:similar to Saccharomyces cerevisiae YFL033C RIM15 Glucose-repressible protein kinase involved in signal transduction during cell proliferation in response to nutrients [Maudiozyma saulgeensis]|uniref:non-specific serine/threonine protein kinase n=1 Tax=Maudiozyma saulgeensis TaxID=1789683 RepID=A0A1X7QYW1_9SACH|nr:similar to Saccharomyces cerevisiae YFL033C RIM15 Glucose-repressible protein kinase involved in signal transduction during cell proliferation in response to nutrients [Kazachstania saulgeensis]